MKQKNKNVHPLVAETKGMDNLTCLWEELASLAKQLVGMSGAPTHKREKYDTKTLSAPEN